MIYDVKFSIVIVTYNALDYVLVCLETLKKYSTLSHEIIVVDNHSKADMVDYLRSVEGIILVENEKNRLWAPGNNQGIELAKDRAEFVILMNSDIKILRSDWLQRLEALANSEERIGIVGPVWNTFPYKPVYGAVDGCCFMIRSEVIREIGYLDEKYPWNGAGFIYSMKALHHSWKSAHYAGPKILHHYGKRSRVENRTMLENQDIDVQKVMRDYNIKPNFDFAFWLKYRIKSILKAEPKVRLPGIPQTFK